MPVHVASHPLVRHKIGLMRRKDLDSAVFRALAREVAALLAYEATRDLLTVRAVEQGWAGPVNVERVDESSITLAPVLRAGLGVLEGVQALFPSASVSVIGMERDEKTLTPRCYYAKIVSDVSRKVALVLDPMLATGGTVSAVIDLLKESGCKDIRGVFFLGAPEGVSNITRLHPDVSLHIGALDEKLNSVGYILPGFGDAGDILFGTR
jgi:uracil phosphoribosyltransferase